MNNLQNKVLLIGNLRQDVQLSQSDKQELKAQVPITTSEVRNNSTKGDIVEIQWHHLVGWGETAEFMNLLLHKGNEVAIQGKLQHRKYTDEQGQMRYYSEVVVSEFLLLR